LRPYSRGGKLSSCIDGKMLMSLWAQRGRGVKGGGGEKGGEMTQTLYAHMNKIKNLKKTIIGENILKRIIKLCPLSYAVNRCPLALYYIQQNMNF
jgi:hypothetical protein